MADVVQFDSLPGVAGGILEGPIVRSPRAAVDALLTYRASSAAGDEGAIQVWIDDRGVYHAGLYRYSATIAQASFQTKVALITWLRAWWPAMREPCFSPEEKVHG